MKRFLFIFRYSYDASYILKHVYDFFSSKNLSMEYKFSIILETGKTAKIAKLKRMFKQKKIYIYPYIVLNLFMLLCYNSIMTHKMKRKLGKHTYPDDVVLYTDSINDPDCVEVITKNNYDCIFIYGTSIVTKKTLNKITIPIYNIHCSILPYFRNVHSDFWAYLQKQYDKIGVTIIKLDAGIDTGDILIQDNTIIIAKPTNLIDFKVNNLKLIVKLLNDVIVSEQYIINSIPLVKQNHNIATYSKTPTFIDIISYILHEFLRKNHI